MVKDIGRYEIRGELGRGAMAVVYQAYDPVISRTLAIKLLHEELCVNAEYRARFLREAKAAGMLSHANIVTIFDVGEFGTQPYIAMEELDGVPLNKLMAGSPLAVREAVDIGIQLAQALHYAHEHGVIHRDIKPGNIVRLNDSNLIKVTDFGICHVETADETQQTRMGQVLGTPLYMSPEQVSGEQVDGRSDIFSAGIVLYQLLCGKRPFEGDSMSTVMYQIVEKEPAPIAARREDLPSALGKVVEKCLKKNPDKRFQTGEELAQALLRVRQALDDTPQQRDAGKFMPFRVKWSLIMAGVVAFTMVLTATIIHQKHYDAMADQVMEYGGSLARFMATESAVPVLTQDWVAIEVYINETAGRQQFGYLTVVDHEGVIRGSSDAASVNRPYDAIGGDVLATRGDVLVRSHVLEDGAGIFDFEAPILFQGKEIGAVHLGIFKAPLRRVAGLSLWLMGVLLVVTVSAVMAATYIIGQSFSRPVKRLLEAMNEIGEGRLDHRIVQERKDEFGELFQAFDAMAESVDKAGVGRQAKSPSTPD